jgi:hypothetical protein
MSTPERADDPGQHGYGGAKQDFPVEEQSGDRAPRPEDDDEQAHGRENEADEKRQGGEPPTPKKAGR